MFFRQDHCSYNQKFRDQGWHTSLRPQYSLTPLLSNLLCTSKKPKHVHLFKKEKSVHRSSILGCDHMTRRPCWWQVIGSCWWSIRWNFFVEEFTWKRSLVLKVLKRFFSQTTNMAAVTSRANQQYLVLCVSAVNKRVNNAWFNLTCNHAPPPGYSPGDFHFFFLSWRQQKSKNNRTENYGEYLSPYPPP